MFKRLRINIKNNHMKRFLITPILFMVCCLTMTAQPRPKLVVGIAVDQMRWDYLYRFYDEYTEGGFRRMLGEGFTCENCQINYIPSITAIGHASAFTGSVPSIHGIAGNNFMKDGEYVYCCEDAAEQTVGSDTKNGQRSPRNLLVTTIGDELKTATSWQSKVIGISFKDRAAIFPSGHQTDAAYWFDGKALRFITSTYYMKQLPQWVDAYNKDIEKQLSTLRKQNKDVREDGKPVSDINLVQYTPMGNHITADMARLAIENEQLGQRGQTDMLTVSFSCTDLVGHRYGTHHERTHEQYIELDKELSKLFSYLDGKLGKGHYLVFLTADHGAANGILQNQEHRIPSDGFYIPKEEKLLNEHLQKTFGTEEKLSKRIMDYKVVLDHEAIARTGIEENKVRACIVDFLKTRPTVMYCFDMEHISEASIPALIKEKALNGYNRERSGDIQIILKPAHYAVWDYIDAGTTHGLWNPYDCHIPFVLFGWGVKHGATQAECHISDIAPTVCALLHIQAPNGCIGNPVVQVTDH